MNLPSIPTDNLYKFCAVSGVVLLLFGATFPVQKLFETQDNLDRVETEIAILKAQTSAFQEEAQRLKSDAVSLQKDIAAAEANPRNADVEALRARNATANTSLSAASKEVHQLRIMSIREKGNVDHVKHLVYRVWLYITAAAAFMFGGLSLARFGFLHWYYRVQKPSDEILQHQSSVSSG
jgi:hypothetical protein